VRFVLTTCCADKRDDVGPLPAVERYRSPRIDEARRVAQERGLPLLILSGVYGVLRADEGLPWYDHALQPDEVDALAPQVVARLRELAVTELVLLLRERSTSGWAPYHRVVDRAVEELGLNVERVPVTALERSADVLDPDRPAGG
jgi:hypothetical protein